MNIVVLGLTLSSSWGNTHANTYRCLLRALGRRGHSVHFLERDQDRYVFNRDLTNPDFCRIDFYDTLDELRRRFDDVISDADAVILGSYVPEGAAIAKWVMDLALGVTVFYDIDTPLTLEAIQRRECDYVTAKLIPEFDLYLSFSGGPTLDYLRRALGARAVHPLYCSADIEPVQPPCRQWAYDLGFHGTYTPDCHPGLERLMFAPARQNRSLRFALAGAQFPDAMSWPDNVHHQERLSRFEHPSFYRAQRFTLNVTRPAMIRAGYSPSARFFEAAACGTPIITDFWDGLDDFFEPGREVLVANSTDEVREYLHDLPQADRQAIADRAWFRFSREHSPDRRAAQLEKLILDAQGSQEQQPAPPNSLARFIL